MAKIPSIALIPSGYKATKIYSVLPVDGGGDFTFDRGTSTTQTRVNKSGLIEDVAQDVPRLDYLDGGCPSLLLEPATTNLVTYSEDFSHSSWTTLGSGESITSNNAISPKGDLTADLISGDGSSVNVYVRYDVTLTASTDNTFSVFAKAGTNNFLAISAEGFASATNTLIYFDLSNGTIPTGDGEIEDYGNGWYRCSITTSIDTDNVGRYLLYVSSSGSSRPFSTTAAANGQNILLWGAQLEQKSYATSYIPTSGSTETRDAETCNGAGSTDEINSTEGVIYWETKALNNPVSNTGGIGLTDGTADNKILLYFRDALNDFRIVIKKASINVIEEQVNFNYAQYNKIALNFADNNVKLYINGIIILADTTQTMFGSGTLNDLSFNLGGGSDPVYCRTKRLSVYDSALTDSQLEALTGFGSFAEMKSYLSYS